MDVTSTIEHDLIGKDEEEVALFGKIVGGVFDQPFSENLGGGDGGEVGR